MDTTDAIIDKIKKAIRLANRTTSEGERDTAMRLAKNLADRNGIAFEDIKAGESDAAKAVKVDDETKKWINGSKVGHVCYILREHFGVVVMFNQYGRNGKKTISWFGSRLNIDIAKHVWHILMRESEKAWAVERGRLAVKWLEVENRVRLMYGMIPMRNAKIPRNKKTAFMQGFFWAINQKLKEHPLRNDLEADKEAAKRKFEEFKESNEVKSAKNRKAKADYESIASGISAGSKINLNRPCEGNATSPLALTA